MKNLVRKIGRITAWASACTFSFLVLSLQAHAADAGILANPLNSAFSTIPKFISGVLQVVVMISLPVITLFFVVVGYKFISAQGSEGKLTDAKKNLWYAVLGALLILGAWVIATLIAGTVTQIVGQN